jgi:hypothetical protein
MFNIPPARVLDVRAACVCLNHGKPEPHSQMRYEIRPIEQVTDSQAVQELCKLVGQRRIERQVAQAAVWHLNSYLSWQQLAAKRIERADGESYPYFSTEQLQQAYTIAGSLTQPREGSTKLDVWSATE